MARRFLILAFLALSAAACANNESTIARGDRLWADSSFDEALAEYRLAVAQHGDEDALARLAHAYAATGQLSEARETYGELLSRSPAWADQAVYDYLHLLDRAMSRGDDYGVATALDAALSLRPELQLPDAILPVARYHRDGGSLDRALDYYRRALTTLPGDSVPEVLYEIGTLDEDMGRCETAIDYMRAFQVLARRSPRRWRTLTGEATWHIGNCAFNLAKQARRDGQADTALAYYGQTIELGEPENLLTQAWFERGEILYDIGRFQEALEAYRTVVRRSPSRAGQLVERAQRRIDEIRFGVPSLQGSDTTGIPEEPGHSGL